MLLLREGEISVQKNRTGNSRHLVKQCITCASHRFETDTDGQSQWSSIGDVHRVTEDLAWDDITKIQNVLWEKEPGNRKVEMCIN